MVKISIHRLVRELFFCAALMIIITPLFAFAQRGNENQSVLLAVPFTTQAPFGNWNEPWQDFCEEASVVMAAHFLWGVPLSPARANQEMQIIRQYENIVFGRYQDTSADETARILRELYGFKDISVQPVNGAQDIKRELSAGRIVIVPAAGRILKNPYFKGLGPEYHMLVVVGYDDARDVFIAHDPGTRRGKNYPYPQARLIQAIHDWNNGNVETGEKVMMVVGRG